MKPVDRLLTLAMMAMIGGMLTDGAIASAQSLPRLTPLQIQRFSRDLTRSSSEDFFRKGKEQFEREARLLLEKRSRLSDDLLKISPELQQQRDLSPLEEPQLKPER